MDVGMPSTQAYKTHKQGTLVSKVLGIPTSLHQWLHYSYFQFM